MTVEITDGHVSAIKLLRRIGTLAPAKVKARFRELADKGDWDGSVVEARPLIRAFSFLPFTAAEFGFVATLNKPEQDVVLFCNDLRDEKAAAVKAKVDKLLGWGAWESVANMSNAPKVPYKFNADDVRHVFDRDNSLPAMSDGVAQAKTFLDSVAASPTLKDLDDQIKQFVKWGGFQTIVDLVTGNPKIPYKFNADDVRTLTDPGLLITPRPADQVKVLGTWDVFKRKSQTDENVAKYYGDLTKRVQHGCWVSIAKMLNDIKDFPLSPVKPELLRAALDPTGQYGEDVECASCGPPPTPGWAKALVWSIGAGLAAYSWTLGAGNDIKDWGTGTGEDIKDFGEGIGAGVEDWANDSYGAAEGWATGAMDDTFDWAADAPAELAGWATNAAEAELRALEDVADIGREIGENAAREAERRAKALGEGLKNLGEDIKKTGESVYEGTIGRII